MATQQPTQTNAGAATASTIPAPGRLAPVRHRTTWMLSGLICQLAGIGGPTAYVVLKAKHESIGGLLTTATVRLAWHESLHSRAGLEVLVAGALLFTIGSVLLARPYAKRKVTWLVAVPIAAAGGALFLGAIALFIGLAIIAAENGGDLDGLGVFGSGSSGKAKPADPTDTADPQA